MYKPTLKVKKAIEALNNAITNLPEFQAVMRLVPSNVAVTNCDLVESDSKLVWGKGKNKISYEGETIGNDDGNTHDYLVNICGQEYLSTTKSILQLVADIETAMKNAPKGKTTDMNSLQVANYLRYELDWDVTDEVYPHMRMNAEGTFSINK